MVFLPGSLSLSARNYGAFANGLHTRPGHHYRSQPAIEEPAFLRRSDAFAMATMVRPASQRRERFLDGTGRHRSSARQLIGTGRPKACLRPIKSAAPADCSDCSRPFMALRAHAPAWMCEPYSGIRQTASGAPMALAAWCYAWRKINGWMMRGHKALAKERLPVGSPLLLRRHFSVDTSEHPRPIEVSTPNCRRLARAEQYPSHPRCRPEQGRLGRMWFVKVIQERSST
jgi:hypothetical protein